MATEKSKAEEEYFLRLEREQLAKAQAASALANAAAERQALKDLHADHCGKCGGAMNPRDFQGVEIDVCDDCGAVLLDPGELEQLAGKDASGAFAGLASLFRFKGK